MKNASLAAFVFLSAVSPAMAGGGMTGGATEVTQLLNNVQLAMQSVNQELQYATQLEQYYTDLLQQMPAELTGALDTVRQVNGVIQKASQVYSTGQRLYGSLDQMKSLAEGRFREFGASGLTSRVRQLRPQVLVFARAHFQKCHYNSASCSGAAGFSIPNA